MWFEKLFGFAEQNPEQVRNNLKLENGLIYSVVNGQSYDPGIFQLASLAELRKIELPQNQKITLSEAIGDVKKLHGESENNGAVFQAASQFNLLEMASPNAVPEDGVGIYDYDKTQGPACAIACGAGTVYRNYFVNVKGQIGQTADLQIDCLEDIEQFFQEGNSKLWNMKNGYCLAYALGLDLIRKKMTALNSDEYEYLKGLLKVGIQHEAAVTAFAGRSKVTQVYCSGVPVAYSGISSQQWEPFGKMILEATYEATFWAAINNMNKGITNKVFLTLVGGGVFGNPDSWLYDAITLNLKKFENSGLDVIFVSYGSSNSLVRKIINDFKTELN
jgi:hypothetical protein